MSQIVLTESQLVELKTKLYRDKVIKESAGKLQLNEATGWNTFFDYVGIIDPTGMVDFFNGLSYFDQGDNFFGILSMVSAIPLLGDMAAKPLMISAKAGKTSLNMLRGAMATGDAVQVARAAAKSGPEAKKFVSTANQWSQPLMNILEKGKNIPLIGGFFKTIEGNVKLLTASADAMNAGKTGMSVFRNYGINRQKGLLSRWWQRGLGLQKNIQLSKQLAATKFWSRFLDSLGIANFVGPDKFESIYGPQMTQEALETYASTTEGQSLYQQEIAKLMGQKPQTQQSPTVVGNTGGISQSPITSVLLKLLSPI